MVTAVVSAALSSANAQVIPSDTPSTACTVTSSMFASWFKSGSVTANGVVDPANSAFDLFPNCPFYRWSQRMFLWLTSPAPTSYGGGGGRIFNSPAFYDVSPPDSNGDRTFIPHVPGQIMRMGLRAAKVDASGLPIIFDKRGRVLEVELPRRAPSGNPLILNRAGRLVEVQRVTVAPNGKAIFLDKLGKTIPNARPMIRNTAPMIRMSAPASRNTALRALTFVQRNTITVQKFTFNGHPFFIDPSGNAVGVEQGQADGMVLQAQNGSLIYYATMVNDVYAYYLTGQKHGAIAANHFPISQAELDQVTMYAAAHGKPSFPDANALAIEVKSSWVEAAGLPNLASYITMTATIPTYDTSDPNHWTPNGQKTVQMALVGIHVVGSSAGHPEMVWATFEHVGNTPNATYTYNSTSGPKTVAQSTAGTWLFATSNSTGPFDIAHMNQPAGALAIASMPPNTISPSDTIRWKAFGTPSDSGVAASFNTDVISIDHSVNAMLASGDVRKNYFMTGTTWTKGGGPPNGTNEEGTNLLANTTMETYQQGIDTTKAHGGVNCFFCHQTNTVFVSHVYPGLKPLF